MIIIKHRSMLVDPNSEFSKLDKIDKLVCLDILDHRRKELISYVEYISMEYKRKSQLIDSEKLLVELKSLSAYAKVLDKGLPN